MSPRRIRLFLGSAMVLFAAGACSSTTGPVEVSSEATPHDGATQNTENQGSDSIRAAGGGMANTENQGSDS